MKIIILHIVLFTIISCTSGRHKTDNGNCLGDIQEIEEVSLKEHPKIVNKKWVIQAPSLGDRLNMKVDIIAHLIVNASYGYNLKFSNQYDSCEFSGWNETFKLKVSKIDDNRFRVDNGNYSYWDFKFNSETELLAREVYLSNGYKSEFVSYQSADTLNSDYHHIEEGIKNIVEELILGKYEVINSDSIVCESKIIFKDSSQIEGFEKFTLFSFNIGNWEIPDDYNEITLFNINKDEVTFAFEIVGDTLDFREIGEVYMDQGSGFYVRSRGKSRLKLKKIE